MAVRPVRWRLNVGDGADGESGLAQCWRGERHGSWLRAAGSSRSRLVSGRPSVVGVHPSSLDAPSVAPGFDAALDEGSALLNVFIPLILPRGVRLRQSS